MKKLFFLLALPLIALFAQSTNFYTWNLQVSPADSAVPVSVTLDGAVALANYLFHNSQSQTTLNGGCAIAATSCTLTNATGVIIGNGICFAAPCNIVASATGGPPPTTFALTAGEVALVTAVSGNTLTLKRASIGTAAGYNSGQGVTVLVAGSYSYQVSNLLAAANAAIIQNPTNGSYTATQQAAVIATALTTLQGAH